MVICTGNEIGFEQAGEISVVDLELAWAKGRWGHEAGLRGPLHRVGIQLDIEVRRVYLDSAIHFVRCAKWKDVGEKEPRNADGGEWQNEGPDDRSDVAGDDGELHVGGDDSDFAEVGAALGAGESDDAADAVVAVAAERVGAVGRWHKGMVSPEGRIGMVGF